MKRLKRVLELERVRPEPFLLHPQTRARMVRWRRGGCKDHGNRVVRFVPSARLHWKRVKEGVGFGWIELSVGEVCGELDELEG